jgi:hypothetical protein
MIVNISSARLLFCKPHLKAIRQKCFFIADWMDGLAFQRLLNFSFGGKRFMLFLATSRPFTIGMATPLQLLSFKRSQIQIAPSKRKTKKYTRCRKPLFLGLDSIGLLRDVACYEFSNFSIEEFIKLVTANASHLHELVKHRGTETRRAALHLQR